MKVLKQSKTAGFIVIFIGYLIAAAVGIFVYKAIDGELWLRLLIADAAATLTVFIFSLIFNNASFYDPYWSVAPIVILASLAVIASKLGVGTIVLLAAVGFWGVRLTVNWAYTFKNLNRQDWRYEMLKQKTGKLYPLVSLLGIHMFPTIVVYCCILPAAYYIVSSQAFSALSLIGVAVCAFAAALQLVSDVQMQRFRRSSHDKGEIIRTGLWKYSRHPNYLGEILMWWGVYLTVLLSSTSFWFMFFGATLNTLMFLFISIPMAENRLKGYKTGFDDYKRQTRMLLPVYKAVQNDDK